MDPVNFVALSWDCRKFRRTTNFHTIYNFGYLTTSARRCNLSYSV